MSESEQQDQFFVKQGIGREASRIKREAQAVRKCGSPQVVHLLDIEDDGQTVATYEFIEGGDASDWEPDTASQIAALYASAAQGLADLHQSGIAHGAIGQEHVLVTDGDTAVLCGLADWRPANPYEISVDVSALTKAAGRHINDLAPLSPLARFSTEGRARRALSDVLAKFKVADEGSPLTANDLADELAAITKRYPVVAEAGEPHPSGLSLMPKAQSETRKWRSRPAFTEPDDEHERFPRWAKPAAALVVGTLAAFVFLGLRSGSSTEPVTTVAPTTTPVEAPQLQPEAAVEAAESTPRDLPTCEDLPAFGECNEITAGDGIVTVGEHRFQVGRPDDKIVIGDWNCDTLITVAVLVPETGEVFVFDEWSLSEPVVGKAVALLERPGAPSVVESSDGCHDLQIPYADGVWQLNETQT